MFSPDGLTGEEISEDEEILAGQLKTLCNKNGKEEKSTLVQSATVLMRLGDLYMQKAVKSQNAMHQKLCLVKSSALLNAARVRFEDKRELAKHEEVTSLLEKLSDCIYDIRGISGSQKTLSDVSKVTLQRVSKLRKDVKSKLETLPRIGTLTYANLAIEKQIIEEVNKLCLETTENYKSIVSDISKECILVLGQPPCRFCQVGLGSMARKEITYYSDFEHVIVLDNSVEKMAEKEQEKIKEYFRWFAVIFQVIIIGLGETFVRSVGVKSINDLYSDDPAKNWYFDVFTPCGIAFDGMVPHSCMNPLGRQNQTKNRRHKVEFIQTAEKMARYLSSEEHLKNGYYIKDILARTCLAFGDGEVYESFENASKEILQSEHMSSVANDLSSKMSGNVNSFVAGERILLNINAFDPKRTFYRPITALLAYLATFFRIKCSSSFEIIDKLEEIGALNNLEFTHKLRYTAAVIIKTRMMAYAKTGHQRNDDEPRKVLDALGDYDSSTIYKCLRYLVIAPAFLAQEIGQRSCPVIDCVKVLQKFNEDFLTDATDDVDRLMDSSKFDEALVEIQKQLTSSISPKRRTKLRTFLLQCHLRLGEKDPTKKDFHFSEVKSIGKSLLEEAELPTSAKLDICYCLAVVHHSDDPLLALEACQNFRGSYRMTRYLFDDLKEKEIATGLAYSCDTIIRQRKQTYEVLLGMELEISEKLHTPTTLYPEIFVLMINEDLYAARFIMTYVMTSMTLNTSYCDFARISYAMFLDEFESHSKELQLHSQTVSDRIASEQGRRGWSKNINHSDDKVSAVTLAQSAILHDQSKIAEKIQKCIDICRRNLHDEDFAFIYAFALATFAFRTMTMEGCFVQFMLMKSQIPASVKEVFLFQITMKRYYEVVMKAVGEDVDSRDSNYALFEV